MAFECSRNHEMGQCSVREPRDLKQEDDRRLDRIGHRGTGATTVMVHGHREFFTHLPQRFVVGAVVQLGQATVGRHTRQQHATGETIRFGPTNFGYCRVDVVQQDLGDAGATAWRERAEVGQPTVVRLQACPSASHIGSIYCGRLKRKRRPWVKRGHSVWVDDLGHNAIGLHIGKTTIRIPVTCSEIAQEIWVDHVVRVGPRIELRVQMRWQVRAVIKQCSTAMTVGGDHGVTVVANHKPSKNFCITR